MFRSPLVLVLLLAVPAAFIALLLVERRYTRMRRTIVSGLSSSQQRHLMKITLWCAALSLLILALARPTLGLAPRQFTPKNLSIMFVIDVSRSMLARDAPLSRLDSARAVAEQFLDELAPGDEIGLVTFSGAGFLQLPLTTDKMTIRLYLEALRSDAAVGQSTDIEAGLQAALDNLTGGAIILLSDGENQASAPLTITTRARDRGIALYTIGFGTTDGAPVPVTADSERMLVGDDGLPVISRLNEAFLSDLAAQTMGEYQPASATSPALIIERLRGGSSELTEPGGDLSSVLIMLTLVLLLLESSWRKLQR